MSKLPAKTPLFLAAWVALGALLNCAGWALSGLHQLNAIGYGMLFLITIVIAIWWWRAGNAEGFQALSRHKQSRRFRRCFPLAFLVLAVMTTLGGILHAPNNYDALSYRIPRILHWLDAGHWYWIHTIFNRLNTRAVGFEWLAAPIMVFTKTDRLLFLVNIASFLLLPGLFFSILIRLGVRRRVAWHWMWLLPTGYSYLVQSGGLGNDLFGATFGLAALDLALRARTSKSFADIWLSALAAALLSGSKLSNLPLLLPWLIAFWPSLRLLKNRLLPTLAIGVAGVACSFLPLAAINFHYCHDWTGFAAENSPFNNKTYALHLAHNTVLQFVQNLTPPVFPWAGAWNRAMLRIIPPSLMTTLKRNFEPSQAEVRVDEIQMEEGAGLGFGVTLLLIVSVLAVFKYSMKGPRASRPPPDLARWAILLSPFISLAVFMAKSGLASEARLETPYYGFVIPLLLIGDAYARIVNTKWWRAGAAMVFLLAAMLVTVTPSRPLWPANYVFNHINTASPLLTRAKKVYEIYSQRADCFAPVRSALPADVKVIGVFFFDYPETSLWRSFGTRRVEHVTPEDTAATLRQRGVQYILFSYDDYQKYFPLPFDQWLGQNHAELVQTIPLDLRAGWSPHDWRLVKLLD